MKKEKVLQSVEWVILDVDGTLTDGGIYLDNNRVETKKFSVKDGCGIAMAKAVGVKFMILTGRESQCVERRSEELKIDYICQGVKNKVSYLQEFAKKNNLNLEKAAYMGDDLNDLLAMRLCGIKAATMDAANEVKEECDYVVKKVGGDGAVREFIEILLKSKGQWEEAMEKAFAIGRTYAGCSN